MKFSRFLTLASVLFPLSLRFLQVSGQFSETKNLPLFPVPLVRQHMPLTKALAEVGVNVRQGYVLFGVELKPVESQEPTVDLNIQPGSTIGVALTQIFTAIPDYVFTMTSKHMINVLPIAAKNDSNDLLNIRVARLDLDNVQPSDILSRPEDFIPEVRTRVRPLGNGVTGTALSDTGPTINLHLKNVTVREILNAVSEAMGNFPKQYPPVGWVYTYRPKTPLSSEEHAWSFIWSVPSNWKEETPKPH